MCAGINGKLTVIYIHLQRNLKKSDAIFSDSCLKMDKTGEKNECQNLTALRKQKNPFSYLTAPAYLEDNFVI